MDQLVWEALVGGVGVLSSWKLSSRMRAKLDVKVDMLRRAEFDERGHVVLPNGALAGPNVYKAPGIYKLRVNGELALRPMLCRGPINNETEWTVLARATERNNDTNSQKQAAAEAVKRRKQIVDGTLDRSEYEGGKS